MDILYLKVFDLLFFQAVVTEIVSPNKIWVQIVDPKNVEPLQDVMLKLAEVMNFNCP